MSDEHDEHGEKTVDPDRAAILARRKHFIALALSGLATTACTDGQGGDKVEGPGNKPESTAGDPQPQPCLSIAQPEPEPEPQPCLKIAQPEPAGTGTDEGGSDGGETGEPPPPEPKPHPCLRKRPPDPEPKPCLKIAAPE